MEISKHAGPWRENVKLAAVFGVASAVTVLLVFPYVLALMPPEKLARVHVAPPVWAAAQALQGGVLCFVLSWIGLRLGQPLGLDAPFVRQWITKQQTGRRANIARAIGIGLGVGAIDVLLDATAFHGLLRSPGVAATAAQATPWKGLLASFYGGVGEEVQTRLFLMTVLAWAIAMLFRTRKPLVYWAACLIAALGFAAGHLPAALQVFPLTPAVVIRVMVLNSIAGVAFGLLYWKRGLEHAMVAHFSADLILHVVAPLIWPNWS